mmetsp:Transcript_10680/g.26985  ORF Transcript_10680/g.26985 Transcript_10680/m.26985 type:complete len:379 (+) Transcript_10680:392-1528(+)|eukprot:CAMPEP_0198242206 /NCGR_PEP_ID=MMETSP1446-20131203/12733_1 /TAXON_ID=1461542 ORGANISM="Unidentified sp, Strain CCMP2111" /NCGR_SAMPLE_ID=MMETSP1446 /ASSEMBLY_ACC=CAM_ASM_001112 /LENGTH=378 /DNA_ID=CAMNT_0043925533 /DNA_START=293 /DNA_END=1429 /DNA_ORIENTATION=-
MTKSGSFPSRRKETLRVQKRRKRTPPKDDQIRGESTSQSPPKASPTRTVALEERLAPAPVGSVFVSGYTVEVGQFNAAYDSFLYKLDAELGKSHAPADISVSPPQPISEQRVAGKGKARQTGPRQAKGSHLVETVQPDDVVLRVAIYCTDNVRRKMQEVLILGSQTLAVLRDCINCMRDHIHASQGFDIPSGFFFINGVFYDDMRKPDAIRYSKPIMDFIQHKQRQKHLFHTNRKRHISNAQLTSASSSGHFSFACMEDVTLNELEVKLGGGNPYVYCHQGCCEHGVAFLDMRRIHADDKQLVSEYPYTIYERPLRMRPCMICAYDEAIYVTYGDKKAIDSPCLFCEQCYDFLHKSSDGELLYDDFEVYRYPFGIPKI